MSYLAGQDVMQLYRTSHWIRKIIRNEVILFAKIQAGILMANFVRQHLSLHIEIYAQELELKRISRSETNDPRVPPRIEQVWVERGLIQERRYQLTMVPIVQGQCIFITFDCESSNNEASNEKPMLIDVTNNNHRRYTVLSLKLHQPNQSQAVVLRRYSYLKGQQEMLHSVPVTQKNLFTNAHSTFQYDLISYDGSMQMQLQLPVHVDSLLDYFLIQKLQFCVHKQEIYRPYFRQTDFELPQLATKYQVQVC